MDWLLRPVLEGCLSYDSLVNGSVNLNDVARLNDAITVKYENQRRAEEAARKR